MKLYEDIYSGDYEAKYGGANGPFDAIPEDHIRRGKSLPTEVKSSPDHFKKEKGKNPPDNQPRCPKQWDTYEAIYSKSGSLTESTSSERFPLLEQFIAESKEYKRLIESGIITPEDII